MKVWSKDIDCGGVVYHTTITKPPQYNNNWQIALHVKVNGKSFHDYRLHFIDRTWDSDILANQISCICGRLYANLPHLIENHKIWYDKMSFEYFKPTFNGYDLN